MNKKIFKVIITIVIILIPVGLLTYCLITAKVPKTKPNINKTHIKEKKNIKLMGKCSKTDAHVQG